MKLKKNRTCNHTYLQWNDGKIIYLSSNPNCIYVVWEKTWDRIKQIIKYAF